MSFMLLGGVGHRRSAEGLSGPVGVGRESVDDAMELENLGRGVALLVDGGLHRAKGKTVVSPPDVEGGLATNVMEACARRAEDPGWVA